MFVRSTNQAEKAGGEATLPESWKSSGWLCRRCKALTRVAMCLYAMCLYTPSTEDTTAGCPMGLVFEKTIKATELQCCQGAQEI